MSKSTPGPWTYSGRDTMVKSAITEGLDADDFPFVIWMPSPPFALGASGAVVIRPRGIHSCAGTAEANARVITSAPDGVELARLVLVLDETAITVSRGPEAVTVLKPLLDKVAAQARKVLEKAGGEAMKIDLAVYELAKEQAMAVEAYLKAWAPYESKWRGIWGHTIHHDIALEPLLLPPRYRLQCFLDEKDRRELVTRCNNCRPVKGKLPAELVSAWEECVRAEKEFDRAAKEFSATTEYLAMRQHDVPLSTWNGKSIF